MFADLRCRGFGDSLELLITRYCVWMQASPYPQIVSSAECFDSFPVVDSKLPVSDGIAALHGNQAIRRQRHKTSGI